MKKHGKRDSRVVASGILVFIIVSLFAGSFIRINAVLRNRSISRMEEGVNTVIEEVSNKFKRDSEILNAAAEVISAADLYDVESISEIMSNISPLLDTMKMRVLMPDGSIITASGDIADGAFVQ